MKLAINRLSALRVLRNLRSTRALDRLRRCDLPKPDPAPRQRWTTGMLPLGTLVLDEPPSSTRRLDVAVPSAECRLQASFAKCTVYSHGLPAGSFVEMQEGLCLPCPELLFVELADAMPLAAHVLLGYELCGTYSRDAADPRNGATFNLAPATSVDKMAAFLDSCDGVRGVQRARANLAYVRDNAWSPMEAVVAALAVLPPWENGYGFTSVELNPRHDNEDSLVEMGCAPSRVPDIVIPSAHVGINYDGHGHLELTGLVNADNMETAAQEAKAVRAKYVDDLRRNRELASQGLAILPVVAEDLYQDGGLDSVMLEVARTAETLGGADMREVRKLLRVKALKRARQEFIWSMLPGERGKQLSREMAHKARSGGKAQPQVEATVVL